MGLVGFGRSDGDDHFKGAHGLSSRFTSECRSSTRSQRQDLSGQHVRGWRSPQDVIQVSRTHGRNQGSCTLVARTQDSPGRWSTFAVKQIWQMCHRVRGVSTCGPCNSPHNKNSCTWSRRPWAHRCVRTRLSVDRAQLPQDSQRLFTVVTVQLSTACSSTGRRCSRCGSSHLGISCLKFWEKFEHEGQEVFSSTPIDSSCPSFKERTDIQLPTTSCHHRIFASDHTIRTSSSLLSIERCNCGQWSSTVSEG